MKKSDYKLIVGVFGTQNTGKSTFINDVIAESAASTPNEDTDASLSWSKYGDDYRDVIARRGLKINRNGNLESQSIIHSVLVHNIMNAVNENAFKRMIMDRTVIDSFAYTYWHYKYSNADTGITKKDIERMWEQVLYLARMFDSLIWIPLSRCENVQLVDDKFRDTNVEYRQQIDDIMGAIWKRLRNEGCNMDVIFGSRDKRVQWFLEDKVFLLESNKENHCADIDFLV